MGIYEDVQKAHAIQKEITGSFFSGEATPDLVKRIETDIKKGKKAEIGEVRMYSGKPWVKVSSTGNPNKDWQPQKSVKGSAVEKPEEKKEENTVKVLDSKGDEKKTHEVDTDINGIEVKPGDNVVWHHKKNGVNQYTKGVVSNEMDSFGHLMVEFEGSKILSGSVPYKAGVTVLPKDEVKKEEVKGVMITQAMVEKLDKVSTDTFGDLNKGVKEFAESVGNKYTDEEVDRLVSEYKEMKKIKDPDKIKITIEKKTNPKTGENKGEIMKINGVLVCETTRGGDYFCTIKNGTPSNIRDKFKKTAETSWKLKGIEIVTGFKPKYALKGGDFRNITYDTTWGDTGAALTSTNVKDQISAFMKMKAGEEKGQEAIQIPDKAKKVLDKIKELTGKGKEFSYHRSMGHGGYAIDGVAAATSTPLPVDIDNDICELILSAEEDPKFKDNLEKVIKDWGFKNVDKIKFEKEKIGGLTYRWYDLKLSK